MSCTCDRADSLAPRGEDRLMARTTTLRMSIFIVAPTPYRERRWTTSVCLTVLMSLLIHLGSSRIVWSQPSPQLNSPRPSAPPADDEDEGPLVADSTVGYMDNSIVGNQLRFRYDSNYNATQPARAEFIWPVDGNRGPGPGPETSVDYQDLWLYGEAKMGERWSLFGELPVRFANPEIQDNTAGLGDANLGFKYALHQCACDAKTFQLRLYVPTGDGDRGLGTDHYSLEPGLLFYRALSPRWSGYAEIKDWIAIDGSQGIAGNVLRYGLGTSYRLLESCEDRSLSAVAEFVGWTVLDGGTAITTPGPSTQFIDAVGDTIVNAKVGLRWQLSEVVDLYGGYGKALTEQTWYSDMFRIELRRSF